MQDLVRERTKVGANDRNGPGAQRDPAAQVMALIENINESTSGPELHRGLLAAFGDRSELRLRRGSSGTAEQIALSWKQVPHVGQVITISYYSGLFDHDRIDLRLAHSQSAHGYLQPKPDEYLATVAAVKEVLIKDFGYNRVNHKLWAGDREKNGLQLIRPISL